MRHIFLDSSALVAMADWRDPDHDAVTSFIQAIKGQASLITTDYVLDETVTVVKKRYGYELAVQLGRKLRASNFCRYYVLTLEDEALTWATFEKYSDKAWSYTDCSCLAVMQRLQITEVLSLDAHFRQTGIQVWP
ncbi:MAG: PIN domain-containing protein [Anaerolineae bacterium]|jgi:predicted nucleic acid-binding protein